MEVIEVEIDESGNGTPIGYISLSEAAKKFDISEGTLRQRVNRGTLKTIKLGRENFVREDIFIPKELKLGRRSKHV